MPMMILSNQHRPVPRDEVRIDIHIGHRPSEDFTAHTPCAAARNPTASRMQNTGD